MRIPHEYLVKSTHSAAAALWAVGWDSNLLHVPSYPVLCVVEAGTSITDAFNTRYAQNNKKCGYLYSLIF